MITTTTMIRTNKDDDDDDDDEDDDEDDDDEDTSWNAEASLYVAEAEKDVEDRLRQFLMRAWSEWCNR